MKNFITLLVLVALCGCVVVGDFPEKRVKLHEMGHEKDYCQKNPDRCVNDVPW